MIKKGVVKRWDPSKGFGFIRSPDVSADVFFYIRAFRSNSGIHPHEGMAVQFEEIHVGGKGPRATLVQPLIDELAERILDSDRKLTPHAKAGKPFALTPIGSYHPEHEALKKLRRGRHARASSAGAPTSNLLSFLLSLVVWAALLVFGLVSQRLSLWALPILTVLNISTIFAYAFDKNAAERGWRRTQEATLHLLALAGGWPAAWLAQQIMRHKTSKQSFQSSYWTTVLLHCAGLGAWIFWLYKNLLPLP